MNKTIVVFLICIAIVKANGNYRDAFLKFHNKNIKLASPDDTQNHKNIIYSGVLQNLIEQILRKEIEAEQQQIAKDALYMAPELEEIQTTTSKMLENSNVRSKAEKEEWDNWSSYFRFG
jgi:hypothetical protein